MTVECPRCGTLYRRPARSEHGTDATYRCARCHHVFEAAGDEPAMVADPDDADERFTFGEEENDDDEEPPLPAVERARPSRPARDAAPRAVSPARFAIRSMLLVTLGYGALSVYLYANPEVARRLAQRVPVIGSRLVETRLDPGTVRLGDLRGEYARVQGDRLVFVISGKAVNTSAVPVRGIQVEGRIVGAQEQRQVVFCGATPRDVHDLSLREIALLQTLEPPRDWTLAPGEQASFLVVFTAPPSDLREFGAEVVAVQAPTRRA